MADAWYIDYSKRTLSAAAILAAKVGPHGEVPNGCLRYIDKPAKWAGKHTNRTEYQDHTAHGLEDFLIIERTVNDCLHGFAAGRELAQAAVDGAEAVGYDNTKHIFVACDRHFVQPKAGPVVTGQVWQDFLGGAESILGKDRLGAYAFSEGMDAARGHATAFWQAGSENTIRPWTNLWQDNKWKGLIDNVEVDRNRLQHVFGGNVAIGDQDVEKIRRAIFGTVIPLKQLNPDGTLSDNVVPVSFEELHKFDDARAQGATVTMARLQSVLTAAISALAAAVAAGEANDLTEAKMRSIVDEALANAIVDVSTNIGGSPVSPPPSP